MNDRSSPASLIALGLGAVLSACGGGGGSGGAASGSFAAVELLPAPGERGVELDTVVVATFNRPLHEESLDEESFLLEDARGRVATAIQYDADTHTLALVPEGPLARMAGYTVQLRDSIRAADGQFLASPLSWSFVTREGVWDAPRLVDEEISSASVPHAAIDARGSVVAVWTRWDGQHSHVAWSRGDAFAGSWEKARDLTVNRLGDARSPRVAVNARGDAMAVWYEFDGFRYDVYALAGPAESALFGTDQPLTTRLAGSASNPHVAVDARGNALAVWYQWDGRSSHIWASRYGAQAGSWDEPVCLNPLAQGNAVYPRVVMGAEGEGLAVWLQAGGGERHVWASRFARAARTWQAPSVIDRGENSLAHFPELAADETGNTLVVWVERRPPQGPPGVNSLWSNRFDAAGEAWRGPGRLRDTGIALQGARCAVNAPGDVLVAWTEAHETGWRVWAMRQPAGSDSWEERELLEDILDLVRPPSLALDAAGNACVTWSQREGENLIAVSRRYAAVDKRWRPLDVLGAVDGTSLDPVVVMQPDGAAVVLFAQWDGTAQRIQAKTLQ
ncbi:MAG: Ig-like domain-containing protein [Planctomycetota bacterium]